MSKEQAARQAPLPPPQFIRDAFSTEEEKVKPGSQRDKMIANFADSDMWKHLRGYIERKQLEVAQKMRETADKSTSMAEIGAMWMVTDKVNQFASDIITHIERVPKVMNEAQKKEEEDE